MLFTIFSVFYVLIAAAMIVLILMQRGDGANAGASFGGGSTGTVFGARGAASFLTRTTGVLAALFFILSLGMGIYLSHHGVAPNKQQALGVMAGAAAPASPAAATSPNIHPLAAGTSAGPAAVPAGAASSAPVPVQHSEVPVAPPASGGTESAVPAAPAKTSTPAVPAPAGSAPPASH